MTRHGLYDEEPPWDVICSDDPHIGLVHADMRVWLEAHPCSCHAMCVCDDQDDRYEAA